MALATAGYSNYKLVYYMQVGNKQFTTDTHSVNTAKIYGYYNNSSNERHHAGLPTCQLAMTLMVKVNEEKYTYEHY